MNSSPKDRNVCENRRLNSQGPWAYLLGSPVPCAEWHGHPVVLHPGSWAPQNPAPPGGLAGFSTSLFVALLRLWKPGEQPLGPKPVALQKAELALPQVSSSVCKSSHCHFVTCGTALPGREAGHPL